VTESLEVVVGVIGRAHGIRGQVVIDVRTDEPERRFAAGEVLRAESSARVFTVLSTRDHSGRLLATFAELADRTAAEQARGTVLVTDVDPEQLPEDAEEFYDRQLVGLRVLGLDGTELGTVTAVLHLLMQDVLEIATTGGARLVPFVAEIVPSVDLDAGTLTVADLTGLLSDEDEADDADEGAERAD
jgi:16S rRNA processing protein RimM